MTVLSHQGNHTIFDGVITYLGYGPKMEGIKSKHNSYIVHLGLTHLWPIQWQLWMLQCSVDWSNSLFIWWKKIWKTLDIMNIDNSLHISKDLEL
jgi:hypothetical protein